jgi:hypothetical protein
VPRKSALSYHSTQHFPHGTWNPLDIGSAWPGKSDDERATQELVDGGGPPNGTCPDARFEKLDLILEKREISAMKTLTVDDSKRIRIPDAEPRQVFAYTQNEDGSITLVPVKAKRKEMFPRGSLLKYMTPERDAEQLAILSGCVQGPE